MPPSSETPGRTQNQRSESRQPPIPTLIWFASKVVGAMDKFAELKPEERLTHLQVFDVPLPKTKSLVLNVDLYCFEGDGEVEVEIPIAAVKKDNE